jgi:hypothetical protein
MVADIARVTYDPTRQYRSLISQQGRVTLEADNNEAVMLESEALRRETIDIIGPIGTPDNGYAVGSGSGGALTVGKGTFYLGGWRLRLDKDVSLDNQPDWIDQPPFTMTGNGNNLVVALLVTEQSVGAIEDRALREVALGGPDSAARSRLMQHLLRIPLSGADCAAGATAVAGLLQKDGAKVDAATGRIVSSARLQAGFEPGPSSADPCAPAAAGGYLGADNQLVRVTVAEFDSTLQTGKLLWGWNNASFLYRASVAKDGVTVTLIDTPVDQEHAPQQNQMVEILRTEADLGDGNYIADCQGDVREVAQAYSFDTQQLVLGSSVDPDYIGNKPPLFVRLWQAEVSFNAGKATPLDNVSGITVAITMDALPTNIAARPFWRFAVRPATPQNIYPQRYADSPQPPDGPRQWIADLAVIEPGEGGWTLLQDCRIPFLPLTQLECGCCGLTLGPNDVAGRGGLQAVVDGLAGGPALLSLLPGTYPLSAPLKLNQKNSGLTIEGCAGGVILTAPGTNLTPFLLGMIFVNGAENITLRQLQFNVPAVPVNVSGVPGAVAESNSIMVGLLVGSAPQGLTVEACNFVLDAPQGAWGAGIVALGGAAVRVTLLRNIFVTETGEGGGIVGGVLAFVTEQFAATALDDFQVRGNIFANVAWGVFAWAQLGLVVCNDNLAFGCAAGFVFVEANLGETNNFVYEATKDPNNVALATAAHATLRPDLLAQMVDKVKPIEGAHPAPAPPAVSTVARHALADQMKSKGAQIYKTMTAGAAPAAAGASAVPTPVISSAAYDKINNVAVAAELAEPSLIPALRIENNEVTLSSAITTPFVGIGATLSIETSDYYSYPSADGSVLVRGNRVAVPDATTTACGLLLPAAAVVTGNLFAQLQPAPDNSTPVPSLFLGTTSPAIMVAANVIAASDLVLPLRSNAFPQTSWEFLNTVI